MYAFRKPFTAGTFETITFAGLAFKPILIAAQVAGYTLSKFLGIKYVSEMPANRRAIGIVLLIGIAELALLLFAITPPPYNFVMLFLNGLPLGMVFGLVLAFLEGRRMTEALAAGLCASFIVSSGIVKSVGRYLIEMAGVSEFWMPFLTGLIFIVPLLVFVWMLNHIPAPSSEDILHRSERIPMNRDDRRAFFKRHAFGLIGLISIYILLTVMRSMRDDFAVEIWRDLGEVGEPSIFARSEMLVMLGVVVVNGAAITISSNRRAFLSALMLVTSGYAVILITLYAYWNNWVSAFPFMVFAGFGMYVPYVAFHTTLFERLIAVFRERGTIGYLMYLADATGYLAYVGLIICKNLLPATVNFLQLFMASSLLIAAVSAIMTIALMAYYHRRIPREEAPQLAYEAE